MRYLIVVEHTPRNYCAYVPDVGGCVTTGRTFEETVENMHEALDLHFEGMAEDGENIPEPTAWTIDVRGYVVPIIKTANGYLAAPPDLYDIVAAADTPERVEALVREAIAWRLSPLYGKRKAAPKPEAEVAYVNVDVPAAARSS